MPLEKPPPSDDDRNDRLSEAEHKVVEKILSELDTPDSLNQELQRTLENLVKRLETSAGRIYLAGPRGKTLRLAAHQGLGPEFVSRVKVRSPHVGLTGEAAAKGQTVTLDADHRPEQDLSHLAQEGLESAVAVPVVVGGRVLGAINLADKKVRRFSEENLRLLEEAAGNVALAIRLSRMKDSLIRQEEQIRDLREAVRQLTTANERLKSLQHSLIDHARQVAIAKFTSFIAHQLRNPLMTIGGFASRLDQMIPEDDPKKHYIGVIVEEVQVLEMLLGEALKIYRAVRLEPMALDPAEVLWEAMSRAIEDIGEVTGQLHQDLDPAVGTLVSDREMLVRALREVCENAVEATRGGGDVCLRIKGRPEEVEFIIADTGRGMGQAEVHRVFEPLYSTKELGTGLGMNIAQGIVHRLGGRIEIESEPGKGTTVTVCLPRAFEELKDETPPEAASPEDGPPAE